MTRKWLKLQACGEEFGARDGAAFIDVENRNKAIEVNCNPNLPVVTRCLRVLKFLQPTARGPHSVKGSPFPLELEKKEERKRKKKDFK